MSRRQTAARLKFDDELQASLRRINRPRRSLAPRIGFLACVGAVVFLAFGGTRYIQLPSLPGNNAAVIRTCMVLTEALRSNRLDGLGPLWAEGDAGKALLDADNQRLMETASVHAASSSEDMPAGLSCREFLQTARKQLAEEGVAWEQIAPIAFGGVRAKIMDAATMRDPAVSITGDLYFQAGTRVYALEFTARQCKTSLVITQFWRCQALDVTPEGLKKYSQERYAGEVASSEEGDLTIKGVRRLYVSLPAIV